MDSYSKFETIITSYRESGAGAPFWNSSGVPDLEYDLLEQFLHKSVEDGDKPQSGTLAYGLDMWIAEELRRSGLEESCIWPRLHTPRVLSPETDAFVSKLPKGLSEDCIRQLQKNGATTAKVQGAVYDKQVDVGMSSWLSGPEILISTKTMGGSFGKNLANRFEEAYGDAINLRKRYPLAALGFFFLVDAAILESPSDYSKAKGMLEKLQEEDGAYDCAALLVANWANGIASIPDQSRIVPKSLSAPGFFGKIVELVLLRSSFEKHAKARDLASAIDIVL